MSGRAPFQSDYEGLITIIVVVIDPWGFKPLCLFLRSVPCPSPTPWPQCLGGRKQWRCIKQQREVCFCLYVCVGEGEGGEGLNWPPSGQDEPWHDFSYTSGGNCRPPSQHEAVIRRSGRSEIADHPFPWGIDLPPLWGLWQLSKVSLGNTYHPAHNLSRKNYWFPLKS